MSPSAERLAEMGRRAIHLAEAEIVRGDLIYVAYRKKNGDVVCYNDAEVHDLKYGADNSSSHVTLLVKGPDGVRSEYKTLILDNVLKGRILKPAKKADHFIHAVIINGQLISSRGRRGVFNRLVQLTNQTRSTGISCPTCATKLKSLSPYYFVTFAVKEFFEENSNLPEKCAVSAAICSPLDKFEKSFGRYYSELRLRVPAATEILLPDVQEPRVELSDAAFRSFLLSFPLTPEKLKTDLLVSCNFSEEDRDNLLQSTLSAFQV